MKIVLCHNYYQQRGGEDQSFEDEAGLLESHGHDVLRYTVHNDAIEQMSRMDVARRSIWNGQTYRQIRDLLRRERPDIMHCTNTFPLISPSAHSAARAEGVPVVQSLRNYRLLCPNALLMRGGKVCEDCLGKNIAWPAVVHGCYRESRAASAVVTAMLGVHRATRTWTRSVDLFYTLTDFARQKFVAGGLPADRIVVKPNFVQPDPGLGEGRGGYAVFIGRLSPEKGIDTLLAAWSQPDIGLPLKIIGDGPLDGRVRAAADTNPLIQWLGRRPLDEALSIVGDATLLAMPSVWYETFGRTIIEAFAKGTPVIASKLGAMAEVVDDGRTGLHFEPGNAVDLASKVRLLLRDAAKLADMRRAARRQYERKYTANPNYRMLMAIYVQATALHAQRDVHNTRRTPSPRHENFELTKPTSLH